MQSVATPSAPRRVPRVALAGALVAPVLVLAAARPDLYKIPLEGTGPASRMSGVAVLSPARSPFGLAMTPDGYFLFDIEVSAPTLPPASAYGPAYQTYVVWVASHDLEQVRRLGPLAPGSKAKGQVALNKFLVVVTAEPNADGAKWTGPIVLRGRSPSSYLTNFSGHTMFNGGMPQ